MSLMRLRVSGDMELVLLCILCKFSNWKTEYLASQYVFCLVPHLNLRQGRPCYSVLSSLARRLGKSEDTVAINQMTGQGL